MKKGRLIEKIKHFGQILGAEIIYIFGFLCFYLRFMLHYKLIHDDNWFSSKVEEYGLFEFLSMRYETWSSRIFIEGAMWLYFKILKYSDIFAFVFFSLCFIGVFYGLCYLLKPRTMFQKLVILLFVMSVPNVYFNNAGWGAVILNYIMPLGFGIFALGAVRDVVDCKSILRLKAICYVVATLIAGNLEQYAFIFGGVLVLALMWFYIQNKKIVFIFLAEFGALVCDVVLFLCSQGNRLRYIQETGLMRPELPELSFMDKFLSGVWYLLDVFFFDGYILCLWFLLISLIAFVICFSQHKKVFLLLWSVLAIVFGVIFWCVKYYPVRMRGAELFYILPILLILGMGILLSMFYRRPLVIWFCLMFVGIGLCSIILLGFAPSIYVTGVRIFNGLFFILIYFVLWFWLRYADKIPYCNWIMVSFGLYWAVQAMLYNSMRW